MRDSVSSHVRNPGNGIQEALTETGRFHIETLELNRPPLINYRLNQAHHVTLESEILLLQSIIELQARLIGELEQNNQILSDRVVRFEHEKGSS